MFTKKYRNGEVYKNFTIIKCISEKNEKHGYYLVKCVCGKELNLRTDNINFKIDCGCGKKNRLVGERFGNGVVTRFASIKENGSLWELLCDCGKYYIASKSKLTTSTIISCGCIKNRDVLKDNIVNEKFGILTVIKYSSNCQHKRVLCKCDCGNTIEIIKSKLGIKKSCGCLQEKSGKNHPNYKGCGDLSLRRFGQFKNGAEKRDLDFNLTIEFLWNLFLKQDKKCAITNLDIELGKTKLEHSTASLDRIDSSRAYTEDNVQWVHKDVNIMKSNYSIEYFLFLCEKAINNKKK